MKIRDHYDPNTRTIVLSPDAALYTRFHELAHKEQHETGAAVFVAYAKLRSLRVVGYFVILWLEIDAYRRARRAMEKLGCWDDEARERARKDLMSYVMKREPV